MVYRKAMCATLARALWDDECAAWVRMHASRELRATDRTVIESAKAVLRHKPGRAVFARTFAGVAP
jgi:hypothetical protein